MCICKQCAQLARSCCLSRDIILTTGDINRIKDHSGQHDFFEYRRPASLAYIEQDDDPNWNSYTLIPPGRDHRRVLRHGAGQTCHFLASNGCELPPAVRPLVCRIHPVQFTELRITGLANECPVELLPPGESLLENLQMSVAVVEGLRMQLYDELRDEWFTFPKAA